MPFCILSVYLFVCLFVFGRWHLRRIAVACAQNPMSSCPSSPSHTFHYLAPTSFCLPVYLSVCLFAFCNSIYSSVCLFVFGRWHLRRIAVACAQWVHAPLPPHTLSITSHQQNFLLQNNSKTDQFLKKLQTETDVSDESVAKEDVDLGICSNAVKRIMTCCSEKMHTGLCGIHRLPHSVISDVVLLFVGKTPYQPVPDNCLLNPWIPIICAVSCSNLSCLGCLTKNQSSDSSITQ